MRTFRYRQLGPPSGYSYKVPFSGEWLQAGDLASLVQRVRLAYTRNSKPAPPDLAARIEHDICLRNPESFCTGDYESGDEQASIVTTRDVKEATGRLKLKWSPERFLAPVEQAESRAKVCVTCRLNSKGFCTTCNGLKGYVLDAIGSRTTSLDDQLGVCGVCACIIKAKIHVSKEALLAAGRPSGEGVYPDNCWMVTEEIAPNGK